MVTLMILAALGILYVLIVYPWQVSMPFRLFIGLIITWPVLGLYVSVNLPAGIPDLHYHRGYVGLLLCIVWATAILASLRLPATGGVGTPRPRPSAGLAEVGPSVAMESFAGAPLPSSSTGPSNTAPTESNDPNLTAQVIGLTKAYGRPLRGLSLPILTYVLLIGLSVLNGLALGDSDTTAVAGYIDATLIPVALYFLTKSFVVSRIRLAWLLGAIISAALIVCLTGLYERAFDLTVSAFPTTEGTARYLDVPGGRATGVMGDPTVYGGILGFGLLASLCCIAHAPRTLTKLLIGVVALVLAYGVFVTFTRAAWISVALALLFAQFYFKGMWKVGLPVAAIGCLVVGFMWSGLQQHDVVQTRVLDSENVTGRVERIIWSWERFREHPMLGRGPGALNGMMRQVFPKGFDTSHNTYMTMLVDNGLLTFACFWIVIFGWLAKAKSVLFLKGYGQFERSAVAAMVGFLIIGLSCGMSLELSYFPYYIAMFWTAGAIIERLADACKIDNEALPAGSLTRA